MCFGSCTRLYDVHGPYAPPESYRDRFHAKGPERLSIKVGCPDGLRLRP